MQAILLILAGAVPVVLVKKLERALQAVWSILAKQVAQLILAERLAQAVQSILAKQAAQLVLAKRLMQAVWSILAKQTV